MEECSSKPSVGPLQTSGLPGPAPRRAVRHGQTPHQYQNLWKSPRHQERKQRVLVEICSGAETDNKELAKAGVEDLLRTLTAQMRSEEPVQERKSFS